MKQQWALQGRLTDRPDLNWHTLLLESRRKDLQLDKVRTKAKRLGISADYRAVYVTHV